MRKKVLLLLLSLTILLCIVLVWRAKPKEVVAPNYLKEKLIPFEKPKSGNTATNGTNEVSSQK